MFNEFGEQLQPMIDGLREEQKLTVDPEEAKNAKPNDANMFSENGRQLIEMYKEIAPNGFSVKTVLK